MPRNPRILYEGGIYHIYQRGNNREFIFNDNKHKQFFIKQVRENSKVFDFELLAYVIMNNHFHLIVRMGKDSLSDIMFRINNVYCKYINRALERTGHAVEGRYNAKLVDNDAYLIWLLRYIHRNPIRANLCNNLDDYKWSSHYFYKRAIFSEFINSKFILNILSANNHNAIAKYLNLINYCGSDYDSKQDFEAVKDCFKLNDNKQDSQKNALRKACDRKSLSQILEQQNLNSDAMSLLISGSQKHSLTTYKIDFIKEALFCKHSIKDISEFLNSKEASIYKLLSRHNISL